MKARPIPFTGPNVRQIRRGLKRQTRRVIRDINYIGGLGQENDPGAWGFADPDGVYHSLDQNLPAVGETRSEPESGVGTYRIRCHHGDTGDHLWVRETWSPDAAKFYPYVSGHIAYRADGEYEIGPCDGCNSADCLKCGGFRWRSPRFMPRYAARLFLEITDIRVERLQDITEEDARREGVESRDAFKALWADINGPESWEASPWCWRVEFRRVDQAERRAA